jgi:hypothetical protein
MFHLAINRALKEQGISTKEMNERVEANGRGAQAGSRGRGKTAKANPATSQAFYFPGIRQTGELQVFYRPLIHGLTSREARRKVDSMVRAEKINKILDTLQNNIIQRFADSSLQNGGEEPQK